MLLLLRKILFYLLLVLYLVITPYVVLYGLGYKVEPSQRELFKTGLISIMTEPHGATVTVEGRRYSKKTPAVIYGLMPGNYLVQVNRKGFEPWQKSVSVDPEKATRLEPVILLPKKPDSEIVSAKAYRDILPRTSEFKLFALQGKTLDQIWKIDLFFKNETQVGLKIPGGSQTQIVRMISAKDSGMVLFKTLQAGKPGYMAYDMERERGRDLSAWMPEVPDRIDWDAKHSDFIYFLIGDRLAGVDLEKTQFYYSLASGVQGFGVKHHRLYYLDGNHQWIQSDARGENPEPLFPKEDQPAEWLQKVPAGFFSIELVRRDFFQKDLLLSLSEKGALISNSPPFELVKEGVRGFLYGGQGGEKVLFWTQHEIGVIDFDAEEGDSLEASPQIKILYSAAKDIQQAFWVYQDSHILFRDKAQVYLLEALGPSPYLLRPVVQAASGSRILYHERTRTLYFLDPKSRFLMKQKLTE